MNVTAPLSIPFYKGLSLIVEPGHEEHLRIALANISAITDAINRFGWSEVVRYFWLTPALADFKTVIRLKNDQIIPLFPDL